MVGLLSALASLGLGPPIADDGGPNAESRRAGRARLDEILNG